MTTTNYCNTDLTSFKDLSSKLEIEKTTVESPKILIITAKYIKKSSYDAQKNPDNPNKYYTPDKLDNEILYFDPLILSTSITDISNKNYIPNNAIALAYVYFDMNIFDLKDSSTYFPRTFKKFWTGYLIIHSNGHYGMYSSGGSKISGAYENNGGNFAALDITLIQLNDANDNISLIFNASTWNILYTNIKFCDTLIKYAEYYSAKANSQADIANFNTFKTKYNEYLVSGTTISDSVFSIPLRMKLIML